MHLHAGIGLMLGSVQRMQALWSTKEEDRTALEARYKQRLREMDVKLKDVAKKERKYSQIERLQARSQETCQRLQGDILAIKQQKVPHELLCKVVRCRPWLAWRYCMPQGSGLLAEMHVQQGPPELDNRLRQP